jgi:hypothetical protein
LSIKTNPANVCNVCGKVLRLPYDRAYRHGAKLYCEDCETQRKISNAQSKKTVETVAEDQEQKKELYALIRKLFQISEVPDKWIFQIDRLIKDGKTYGGLAYTLNYAINYLGFTPDSEYGVTGIINMYYTEAAKNYAKEEEIRSHNEDFDHQSEIVKIRMKPPKTSMWKPTSSIEDL